MTWTGLLLAGVLAVATVACADLQPLVPGICGNAVVDPGEDCDGHAEADRVCAELGHPHACRYLCNEPSGTSSCPTGWGCGADGVCRNPTGTFGALGERVSVVAPHAIHSLDFDGDGALEVLLLSEEDTTGHLPARIVYPPVPSPGLSSAAVQLLPRSLAVPAIGYLPKNTTTDDVANIAFADLNGVCMVQGRSDRRSEMVSLPTEFLPEGTLLRAISLEVLPQLPGDEVVRFLDGGQGHVTLQAGRKVLTSLAGSVSDLVGDLVWGFFDKTLPCEQIALAYKDKVLVLSPCIATSGDATWNEGGTPTTIMLPAGGTIEHGIRLFDVDLDGRPELLIGGANGKTWVASKKDDGSFGLESYALPTPAGSAFSFPLATADLNHDSQVDFVMPDGILLSSASGWHSAHTNHGTPWMMAVIEDFNANGLLDVVAGSNDTLDLDFLNNAGNGQFNPTTLTTDGFVTHLAVGDFDGDLVKDVAVSQSVTPAAQQAAVTLDAVSVAFGAAYGPPEPFAMMGRIGPVGQVVSGRLSDPDTKTISDVMVIAHDMATSSDRLFVYPGSGTRVLAAGFPLHDDSTSALPVALSVGAFGGTTSGIAAVGKDSLTQRLTLWHFPVTGTLPGGMIPASAPLSSAFHAAHESSVVFRYGACAAAGEVDGDKKGDELVVVAPYGLPGNAALVIADYNDQAQRFSPHVEHAFNGTITEDCSLMLRDIDGDGWVDGLLTTGSQQQRGDLLVFWNEGGELVSQPPQSVHVDGGVAGVACLPAASGTGCELALVSQAGVVLAKVLSSRTFTLTPIPELPGGLSITAGDFNRDGTTDLAIATREGLQFWSSLPVLP